MQEALKCSVHSGFRLPAGTLWLHGYTDNHCAAAPGMRLDGEVGAPGGQVQRRVVGAVSALRPGALFEQEAQHDRPRAQHRPVHRRAPA